MLSVVAVVDEKVEFTQVMPLADSSGAAPNVTSAHAAPVIAPLPQ